jgi:hypothetical protein
MVVTPSRLTFAESMRHDRFMLINHMLATQYEVKRSSCRLHFAMCFNNMS